MTKQEELYWIENDIEYCKDFYKNYNYKNLDCCSVCKYSDYNFENVLFCKKIQEKLKSYVTNISEVMDNGICDLFESNTKVKEK